MKAITVFGLLLVLLFPSACAPVVENTASAPTGTFSGTLRPLPSATATVTPWPTDYISPTPSPTITPTPTPVYYEVRLGDDMYSIAFRYGLEPQAVMTANPEVDPRAMIVGMTLLIPITPTPPPAAAATSATSPTATPTAEAVAEQSPDCYPDALGGLWCFMLATNEGEAARENVAALVTLTSGEETRQETAITPLNLLPPGESLPLIAYFQAPVPSSYTVTAEVDFFLPVLPDDARYLTVEVDAPEVTYSDNEMVAHFSGVLRLAAGQPDARYVWVSVTALDAEGRVVAVRRWDAGDPLIVGGSLPFEVNLYSLSGPIDQVLWLVEAQPASAAGDENE